MATEPDKLIGTLVAGRYKVLRRLGEGGMGAVYEVEHQLIGRRFALKTLHAQFARDGDVVARFHREARAAAAIGDEHIIEVSDMGQLDDGAPFIVLELLQGEDLGQMLEADGPMDLPRAIMLARQACAALGHAHTKGIVHRDIKPDNIFITQRRGEDFVKILDFGISKFHEAASEIGQSSLTKTGMALGTPYYMAPEQISGDKTIDARTDVYAMGIVIFQMLTGQVPFSAPTFPGLVIKIMQDPPPSICALRPDVPPELEAIVHRAMAKSQAERFTHITELELALAPFASLPSLRPKRVLEISMARTATPQQWEVGRSEPVRVPKSRGSSWALSVAALALLLLGGWWANSIGTGASASRQERLLTPAPMVAVVEPAVQHVDEPHAAAQPSPPVLPPVAAAVVVAPVVQPMPAAQPVPVAQPAPVATRIELPAAVVPAAIPAPSVVAHRSHHTATTRNQGPTQAAAALPQSSATITRVAAAPPPRPAASAMRMITISNQRRAGVAVALQCGSAQHNVNVAAGARSMTNIEAGKCSVTCKGLGNPMCPLTISADVHALEIR